MFMKCGRKVTGPSENEARVITAPDSISGWSPMAFARSRRRMIAGIKGENEDDHAVEALWKIDEQNTFFHFSIIKDNNDSASDYKRLAMWTRDANGVNGFGDIFMGSRHSQSMFINCSDRNSPLLLLPSSFLRTGQQFNSRFLIERRRWNNQANCAA